MQLFKNWFSTTKFFNMSQKVNYPAADRNKAPILEVLQKHFDRNIDGKVLEISSGTGQHVSYFAPHFPRLIFQPSEYEAPLLSSIKAYANDTPTKNIQDPIRIDIRDDWRTWNVSNDFDYALNVNMMHVAPFSCTEGLFKNISAVLKPGGVLVTYGPYANKGVLEPQSNIDFDASIRARDPEFGIRDIQDLIKMAETYGMTLEQIYDLPANNKCLIWKKSVL